MAEAIGKFSRRPPRHPGFPRTCLGVTKAAAELARRKLFEDALSVALAGSFAPDFGRDHRYHADDLRLRCKPVWIEIVGRPGKVFVHAVEAEPEEMLSLLRRAPRVPAGRLAGAGDRWQARDDYDVAILIDGSGLSQLSHRGASHDRGMWRATGAKASVTRARL